MATAKVQQGQRLIDVAIQHSGDIQALFAIAQMNGISITDDIVPGSDMETGIPLQIALVDYYAARGYRIATGLTAEDLAAQKGGIGFMQISTDFKVS